MKTNLLLLAALTATTLAQGPLTPPGAPAPTMKTLQEIHDNVDARGEKRTAISTLPGDAQNQHIIAAPGSYYLTGNLQGATGKTAILITADRVTIDLNGFSIVGLADSLYGIFADPVRKGARVRNGCVTGTGEGGIALGINSIVEHVTVTGAGANPMGNDLFGISIREGSVARSCIVTGCSSTGISGYENSIVTGCIASGNVGFEITADTIVDSSAAPAPGGVGIAGEIVSRCYVRGGGTGISARGLATDCAVQGTSGDGIAAYFQASVMRCTVRTTTGDGIVLRGAGGSAIENSCGNNTGPGNDKAGILVVGNGYRIEGNQVSANNHGINVTGTGNRIFRNSATANTIAAYTIAGGNDAGPTGTAATATSPFANLQ